MSWTDKYIGIPFLCDGRDRAGCDCWGLVRLVYYEKLNIELPCFSGALTDHSMASLRRVAKTAEAEARRWRRVNRPATFDIILIRRGNVSCHVGICVDRRNMLHIEKGIDAAIENLQSPLWAQRIAGYYSYAG